MQTSHTGEEILARLISLPEPFVPYIGQKYYYVAESYEVDHYTFEQDSEIDRLNVKNRNAFESHSDAIQHAAFRKWLFSQPKMTLAECWKVACYDDELAPDEACAKHFIKLAKENGHL